jgi:hypothetical protein
MSWVAPTVTLDLMKASLSACWARLGSRFENQAPLSPCCFQVRVFDTHSLLTPPCVLVLMPFMKDAGTPWPASLTSSGL